MLLADAKPVSLAANVLSVSVEVNMRPALRARVGETETLLSKLRGKSTRLLLDEGLEADPAVAMPAAPAAVPTADHPLVKLAMESLNARVMGVYPRVNKTES